MSADVSRKRSKEPDYQVKYISKGKIPHENHARMFRSLFYSERYRRLSPTAKDLYTAMLLECKNGQRTSCIFPYSAYKNITTKPSFQKAKKELIINGFIIEKMHFQNRSTVYSLCDDWKLDAIPDREPEYHDISEYKRMVKMIKGAKD